MLTEKANARKKSRKGIKGARKVQKGVWQSKERGNGWEGRKGKENRKKEGEVVREKEGKRKGGDGWEEKKHKKMEGMKGDEDDDEKVRTRKVGTKR
jgi:hypothetical protein